VLTSSVAVAFGIVAGLALGLTGGGGATLAVPLLIYGIGLPVPQAVAISLLAAGASALAGFLHPSRRRDVDLGTGTMLAGTGVAAAPVGAWLGQRIPEPIVLAGFGAIVAIASIRMWQTAYQPSDMTRGPCAIRRRLSWRCFSVLSVTGVTTGLLSGIIGVGGGFLLVPAIVFATGLEMHRAVATSLMVTSVVSASALLSMVAHGRTIPWPTATLFLVGALVGMTVGSVVCQWVSAVRLKQGFAILLGLVGLLVVVDALVRL
jgi:uncharacterized membrane protein YfcA